MTQRSFKQNHSDNTWQIQEAKTHFSQLVKAAELRGVQKITRQGEEVAFLISRKEYEKFAQPKTSLINFFEKSPLAEVDLDIQRDKESKMK